MRAIPLPSAEDVLLQPPDRAEAELLAGGVCAAVEPAGGLTQLQRMVIHALFESMTGHVVDLDAMPRKSPLELATGLTRRNLEFRTRIAQVMLLGELVLTDVPEEVRARVDEYQYALGTDPLLMADTRAATHESLGFALLDFARNGYSAQWSPGDFPLHTSSALAQAWEGSADDPDLAARWMALGDCQTGSLGRMVWRFYRNRGFVFPGRPGSAPPLLAQHDWVHVLAGYGAALENEVEVFSFIGRSIPDPRGFSLLAMVISLFETGTVADAAGLFEASAGHISSDMSAMSLRLADAMRRGALCGKDLMRTDWFAHADQPIDDVRADFGIVPKSAAVQAIGSPTAWDPAGITPYQLRNGAALAEAEGRAYDPLGMD